MSKRYVCIVAVHCVKANTQSCHHFVALFDMCFQAWHLREFTERRRVHTLSVWRTTTAMTRREHDGVRMLASAASTMLTTMPRDDGESESTTTTTERRQAMARALHRHRARILESWISLASSLTAPAATTTATTTTTTTNRDEL